MSSNEENDTPARRTLVSNYCLVVVKLFLTGGICNSGYKSPPPRETMGDSCEFKRIHVSRGVMAHDERRTGIWEAVG